MSDLSSLPVPAQPLRRIVQPTPVARQRKMTIGRIASNSQLMANSFGRSTSIRRSISSDSSVRFPTWLLPALPTRADDLDPYRDRDIIALRQARMKNRVVRQVQPRGLPMAAHAHGRSRSGVQTGPSSIARRLHPIRRQPSKNDAHIGPSTMPLVRVAAQPQRPTARPPRTRSSNTPTRNGNRTDRDGPRPRAVHSVPTVRFDSQDSDSFSTQGAATQGAPTQSLLSRQPSPKFDSVMVARSLLTRPQTSTADAPSVSAPDLRESSHRLTLPRASARTSVDRSAIHRRSLSTRQPLVSPSSRIPLSMMYEAPRRLNTTSVASPSTQVNPTQPRRTSSAPSSSALSVSRPSSSPAPVVARQAIRTSIQSDSAASPTNQSVSATSKDGPSWTSFPTRESSTDQVSRRAVSSAPTVSVPSVATPSSSAPSNPASQSTSQSESQSSLQTASTSQTDSSRHIAGSMPAANDLASPSRKTATVRRRIASIYIPRTAGWRQVMGLPSDSEQPATVQAVSNEQDSLFRRVAALANPTNTPLGSPGDIARRSPVSGSLISIASSMRSAALNYRESTVPTSSRQMERPTVSRKTSRRSVSAARVQRQSATISDNSRPIAPIARSKSNVAPNELSRRTTQRQVNSSRSANTQNSSASSRMTHSQESARSQRPRTSATSRVQKPSFVDMWSSVNHSTARQAHLIARRSLQLPQTRVHSLSSKPGTIARQQFGLNDRSTEAFDQSSQTTVLELRRSKNRRASHALRTASQGNPSSARVSSIARESRSHMSSVMPGASSGTQFAGSLAQAISRRQIQGDTSRNVSNTAPNNSVGVDRRPTTSTAVPRSTASNGSSPNRANTIDTVSLTGAGSHVAQNFLDRLSKKTGEDFAPAINTNQETVSTPTNTDVIARSVAPSSRTDSTREYSLPFSDQSNESSRIEQLDDQPHWAIMRTPTSDDVPGESSLISNPPSAAESSDRAARAMGDAASVTNASIMRSVVANPVAVRSNDQPELRVQTPRSLQRSISEPSTTQSSSQPSSSSARRSTSRSSTSPAQISRSTTPTRPQTNRTNAEAKRSRQEILERGGSIASRGALHRAVSRSVPTQRLSSPLNDLPVSPNVTPGMRIPSEAMSALPTVPNVARVASDLSRSTSASLSAPSAEISRSTSGNRVVSRSASSPSSNNVRRDSHRSVSIRRQANGVQFGPSEDGTISADALVRMIESGQSIPNQVVHRQVSGTTSSGIMRRPSSSDQVSRSVSSTSIRRSSSTVEKAAPGPVSILSQVLAPSDDSESGTNQITTSQLLDLMDWINRIVDDRLRQELERRGVAGGRW